MVWRYWLVKEYIKAVYCYPTDLTYEEYIKWNASLAEAQAGIKIAGRNTNTSNMQMTPPYSRKRRPTKEPLNEGERGEWKSLLKTQHSKN